MATKISGIQQYTAVYRFWPFLILNRRLLAPAVHHTTGEPFISTKKSKAIARHCAKNGQIMSKCGENTYRKYKQHQAAHHQQRATLQDIASLFQKTRRGATCAVMLFGGDRYTERTFRFGQQHQQQTLFMHPPSAPGPKNPHAIGA